MKKVIWFYVAGIILCFFCPITTGAEPASSANDSAHSPVKLKTDANKPDLVVALASAAIAAAAFLVPFRKQIYDEFDPEKATGKELKKAQDRAKFASLASQCFIFAFYGLIVAAVSDMLVDPLSLVSIIPDLGNGAAIIGDGGLVFGLYWLIFGTVELKKIFSDDLTR